MSERPSAGVRVSVVRVAEGEPLRYVGFAHTSMADYPLDITLGDGGRERVQLEAALPEAERSALSELALRLVRAAAKGERPPRKIVRWRELR